MDSYLIRIYRREKDNPEGIVGIIEEIGTEKKRSFRNLSELSEIITLAKRKSGWPHTLHPGTWQEPLGLEPLGLELGAERPPGRPTRRIIKRVLKELGKVYPLEG